MNQEQNNQERNNKPIRTIVGYTALAVAATPVMFGLYVFGLGASYAFKNPKKVVLGTLGAGALLYSVQKGLPQEAYTMIQEQITTSQTSRLETELDSLRHENLQLKQDPNRPVFTQEQSINPYVLGAAGAGLFGLGAGVAYASRRRRSTDTIETIVTSRPRLNNQSRPRIYQR